MPSIQITRFLVSSCIFMFAACIPKSPSNSAATKDSPQVPIVTISLDDRLNDCQDGIVQSKCMSVIKSSDENLIRVGLLFGSIKGFTFTPGVKQMIRVKLTSVPGARQDAAAWQYELMPDPVVKVTIAGAKVDCFSTFKTKCFNVTQSERPDLIPIGNLFGDIDGFQISDGKDQEIKDQKISVRIIPVDRRAADGQNSVYSIAATTTIN